MSDVYLHRIGTAVPEHVFTQQFLGAQMERWAASERERRYVRGIYPTSGIETRHFAVSEVGTDASGIYTRDGMDNPTVPGTAARNAVFAGAAGDLCVKAARDALDDCASVKAADVTHVVVVSCTGFTNPGPDFALVKGLGLPASVERYSLGFMGCHAALPGLKMAAQFCRADPDAVVLVVCVELCSLHLQFDGSSDSLVANALFSDGAAAAVVSARPPVQGARAGRLAGFTSMVVPDSEAAMAWSLGDHGFRLTLSTYVSKIIAGNLNPLLANGLNAFGLGPEDVDVWAVHPGGKSILDRVEEALSLAPTQLAASRSVLRDHGNMSSATVLFVLKTILDSDVSGSVCALAFGPGLTVEMGHLVLGSDDG